MNQKAKDQIWGAAVKASSELHASEVYQVLKESYGKIYEEESAVCKKNKHIESTKNPVYFSSCVDDVVNKASKYVTENKNKTIIVFSKTLSLRAISTAIGDIYNDGIFSYSAEGKIFLKNGGRVFLRANPDYIIGFEAHKAFIHFDKNPLELGNVYEKLFCRCRL